MSGSDLHEEPRGRRRRAGVLQLGLSATPQRIPRATARPKPGLEPLDLAVRLILQEIAPGVNPIKMQISRLVFLATGL
jgi:hypothetical protein